MFPKIEDHAVWHQQVAQVCDVYHEAIELYEQSGVHPVSVDEQTGIQALERITPDLLAAPGRVARREYEYTRHGTIGLFGNLHVATGKILSPLVRESRTEEDFLENIDNVVSLDPNATWRFVTDNLNTHLSESLVRCTALCFGIENDLGVKGRYGILKSVASRREFLTDRSHRIHFVYTPKHCSWLNQIGLWFGTLRKKLTRFGSFTPVEDLSDRIMRFIDYYNATMAKPYRWTYRERLLCE